MFSFRIVLFARLSGVTESLCKKKWYLNELFSRGKCNVHDILIILTKEFFCLFFSFAFLYKVINDVTIFLLWKKKKKKQWIMAKRSYLSVRKKEYRENRTILKERKLLKRKVFQKICFFRGLFRISFCY